jgi:hypothetical protein
MIEGTVISDPVAQPAAPSPAKPLAVLAVVLFVLLTPEGTMLLTALLVPVIGILFVLGVFGRYVPGIHHLFWGMVGRGTPRMPASPPAMTHWWRIEADDGTVREVHLRTGSAPVQLGDSVRVHGFERAGRLTVVHLTNLTTGTRDRASGLMPLVAAGALMLLVLGSL